MKILERPVYAVSTAFLVVGLLLATCAHVSAAEPRHSLSDLIDEIAPSIVQIRGVFEGVPQGATSGKPEQSIQVLGSGFVINSDQYVITSDSAIYNFRNAVRVWSGTQALEIRSRELRAGFGATASGSSTARGEPTPAPPDVAVDVIDEDLAHDLALVKLHPLPAGTRTSIAKLSTAPFAAGEQVAIVGYPLRKPILIATSGAIASSNEFEGSRTPLASSLAFPDNLANYYLADVRVLDGSTGSPVVSLDRGGGITGMCHGSLAGLALDSSGNPIPVCRSVPAKNGRSTSVCDQRIVYSSGLAVVVPISAAIQLIEKHHLKWTAGE